jgi:hypothetical protein
MTRKKLFLIMLALVVCVSQVFSDVPETIIHRPNVPYYMQSMNFQSVQTRIFPSRISGFVFDPYADLIWNPAYLLRQTKNTVYLDFNPVTPTTQPVTKQYDNYFSNDLVIPGWYTSSTRNSLQTTPHYNFGILVPITSKLVVGFMNRLIFDYKPFRSSAESDIRNEDSWSDKAFSNYEVQRLETDDNQQTVLGAQSEILLGYKLSKKIDLGLRLGHYVYNREGDLFDSKWAFYPHSSSANLDDESFNMDGDHFQAGMGVLFHLNKKTRLGFYGSYMVGSSTEKIAALDSSKTWSERDTDTKYYQINHFRLDSDEDYESEATRPEFRITFERDISQKIVFRSFLSHTWEDEDISGSFISSDTTFSDRTYDYYRYSNDHFRRSESHSSRASSLSGSGNFELNRWRWFASLIYKIKRDWAVFGGVQIQRVSYDKEFSESSGYTSHSWSEYSIYDPETTRYYYIHSKNYSFKENYSQWSAFLPIGLKAKISKGLYLLLGTDITFTLTDESSKGNLLYPNKTTRKWEDGRLIVEDIETNRYEEFSSNPAKEFSRTLAHRFGIMYQHKSGARLYFRAFEDVFKTTNWALGFEMNW